MKKSFVYPLVPVCIDTIEKTMINKFFVTPNVTTTHNMMIDYAAALNTEQLAVVEQGNGPCLVLAGAGSGKTRTIVYRVAYLLEQGIDPQHILLLTFTNKAAREMLSRVDELLGAQVKGLWGGTFHSVAHRILRTSATLLGYRKNFSILDQDDARDLVKTVLRDLGIDTKERRFPSAAVLQSMISYGRNARITVADAINKKHARFIPLREDIEAVARGYAEKKMVANAMDFDDLLLVLLELLRREVTVREALQNQFQYILVDEYQDTNPIQAEIVTTLAGKHRHLLVVGDDAQSIYSFRAADIKNILEFPKTFPDAKTFRLETNYRSTPEILALANDSISHNEMQFQKTLRPMQPSHTKPQLTPTSSPLEEASFIAQTIIKLHSQGLPFKSIAVLFRATHHSQALEFELAKNDIPYEYRGGMRFFERSHIKDVLAFLRVSANPADQVAWTRVLSLQVGIGPMIASRIVGAVSGCASLSECFALSLDELLGARSRVGWNEVRSVLLRIVNMTNPADAIKSVTDSHEYQTYLESEYPNWQERIEDLVQLRTFAQRYTDLSEFLAEVSLADDFSAARNRNTSSSDERIVLSTIHQAKGLEWDTVFVMRLTGEDFPNRRASAEEGGMEEERRLFYVAATRAARKLFLTYPVTAGMDTPVFQQPSPFIDELNVKLLHQVRASANFDDTIIEIDESGEPRTKRKSFLRDVDELLF